jgi:hypothetical protein
MIAFHRCLLLVDHPIILIHSSSLEAMMVKCPKRIFGGKVGLLPARWTRSRSRFPAHPLLNRRKRDLIMQNFKLNSGSESPDQQPLSLVRLVSDREPQAGSELPKFRVSLPVAGPAGPRPLRAAHGPVS